MWFGRTEVSGGTEYEAFAVPLPPTDASKVPVGSSVFGPLLALVTLAALQHLADKSKLVQTQFQSIFNSRRKDFICLVERRKCVRAFCLRPQH